MSRLEEFYAQGVTLNALEADRRQLKSVLYEGLIPDIKAKAEYKNDVITDYEDFKMELRKMEEQMKLGDTEKDRKKCAAMHTEKTEDKDMTEVKSLLNKLNERMEQIEKQQKEMKNNGQFEHSTFSAHPYNRVTYRGRGRDTYNHGRGTYRSRRPLGLTTMSIECYHCHQKGHIARNCQKTSKCSCGGIKQGY